MRTPGSIFIVIFAFTSCGPAYYLRKAERAIKKAEQLGAQVKLDTVFQEVKITVPELKVDTLVKYRTLNDTITVVKNRVVTRVKVDTVTKEVFVETKCPERTRIVQVPYQVTKEIKATGKLIWWHLIIAGLVGAGLVALFKR